MSNIAKEFLGKGWKFPISCSSDGMSTSIETSEHEEDIREAILLILSTSKGERIMRPDFGCGIYDLVFSTINTATLGMIKDNVRESLILWEPRIEVLSVDASAEGSDDVKINITVEYIVRATNNEFNLTYPFYIKE